MTRTPFICDGDHASLTPSQLQAHNTRPCKDDLTRAAINKYQRDLRASKLVADVSRTVPTTTPAGDTSAYVDHFAADPAAEEATAPPKPGPPARTLDVSSLGAARRLRALAWLGYTPKDLAHESGLTADSVWWLMIAPPTRIQPRTAELVDATFKRLRVQPRSQDSTTIDGSAANRARAIAELHNWSGPYDWEDIDFAACRPKNTHGRRDATALAKAIEEAKLDTVAVPDTEAVRLTARAGQAEAALAALQAQHDLVKAERDAATAARDKAIGTLAEATRPNPPADDLGNQLRHAQILLDETKAALEHEKSEHAEVAETLTARTKEFNAEYKLYTDKAATALATVDRLEAELAACPVAGTLESFDLLTDEHTALAADMSITIEPTPAGGIRLTLPSHLLAR